MTSTETNRTLQDYFQECNDTYFQGLLPLPVLLWNPRIKSCAGRFAPAKKSWLVPVPPRIEIASYLKTIENSEHHIRDTMAHELIHYWLWLRGRPYGHTAEFKKKAKEHSISLYNTVPVRRSYKYTYECVSCKTLTQTRRKLGKVACARCCKLFARNKFDSRFLMVIRAEEPTQNHL